MTAPRVRCAAAGLYRDKHQCVDTWWTLTTPDGEEHVLCSACCVLEFVCLAGLPADVGGSRQKREAA
jgi:hypothetical protein